MSNVTGKGPLTLREEDIGENPEVILYWAAMANAIPIAILPEPSCRETMLIRKLLDSESELPAGVPLGSSRVEKYLVDMIYGTTNMLVNIPKSDKEKYLHCMIGGTVDEMPNPEACELNHWMNMALEEMKQ